MTRGRANPVRRIGPAESGEVLLADGVRAHVIRGARSGPTVWAWATRGRRDPSMAQALGELRDRLDPSRLSGAVGLLLDGPPPPVARREAYPWANAVRALSSGAAAVVLFESAAPGCLAMPHVALDLDDRASRRVGRALGAAYLTPELLTPPVDHGLLSAPTAVWIDGESERLDRGVVDRATRGFRSLLAAYGLVDEKVFRPAVRVVLKSMVAVEAPVGGAAEAAVQPGALVRMGEVAAWVGEPGLATRTILRAPTTGVVLWIRSVAEAEGAVLGIGKLRRALPAVVRAAGSTRRAGGEGPVDVGWCEHVGLPELSVQGLRAKIDTGARTCALHVAAMSPAGITPSGGQLLDVLLPAGKKGHLRSARVEVIEYTQVRDSGGHADRRPVIETLLRLGPVERRVRVSLTDRGDMMFPMLIGRTALGAEFRVLPQRRFVLGRR